MICLKVKTPDMFPMFFFPKVVCQVNTGMIFFLYIFIYLHELGVVSSQVCSAFLIVTSQQLGII